MIYKKLKLSLFILLSSLNYLVAQSSQGFPISVGVLNESLSNFGLKIGTSLYLKNWQKSKQKKANTILKNRQFMLSPQIGFYRHPQNHTGLLTNVELGIQRQKEGKKWTHLWAVGLGTLTQFNGGITYVQQSDGSIQEKNAASRTYFTPSISYEIGQQLSDNFGWYAKATNGFKLRFNTLFSIVPLLEVGIKTNL